MAYRDFKDLLRRTVIDKAFNIAKNKKYNGYQRGRASMIHKFYDKKTFGGSVNNEIMSNQELAEESNKSIIRKFGKWKEHSSL